MTRKAAIWGVGAYVPAGVMSNNDFARTLDTSDEWIVTRTGISERRVAAPDETTSSLAARAAEAALKDAGVPAGDIDLILLATITPDHPFPATACGLQEKLGLSPSGCPAMDISAACSGFVYGLSIAQAYITSGMANRVLLVGAEVLSRCVDYKDRASCILFGDGAGAVVVGPERTDGPSHTIVTTRLKADGRGVKLLNIPAGGSAQPVNQAAIDERQQYLKLDGREVFKFGVTSAVELIREVMHTHGLEPDAIGAIVPHQANIRIIDAAVERLRLRPELFYTNLKYYGNTSAASIPIALADAQREGKLPAGKPVILAAFGAGLTWASAVVNW